MEQVPLKGNHKMNGLKMYQNLDMEMVDLKCNWSDLKQ